MSCSTDEGVEAERAPPVSTVQISSLYKLTASTPGPQPSPRDSSADIPKAGRGRGQGHPATGPSKAPTQAGGNPRHMPRAGVGWQGSWRGCQVPHGGQGGSG